jgi:uncharacterized membrane protein YdbT with pleckstrin-like domain
MKAWILALMRVPPEPHAPAGSEASVRVFRAGRNYFRFRLVMWAMANGAAGAGLFAGYIATRRLVSRSPEWAQLVWAGAELIALAAFVFVLCATYLEQRLNYEMRWYIVTDRSLRIRAGIWSTHELTTTFANIQEIRVSADPLQKLLGLADVEVHSAGGGSGAHGAGGHVAKFEGLENANEIRDHLVERLRTYRDSGLGEAVAEGPATALAAARAVLEEVRRMRVELA